MQPDVEDRQMSAHSGERGADAGGQSRGEGETQQDLTVLQYDHLSLPANPSVTYLHRTHSFVFLILLHNITV